MGGVGAAAMPLIACIALLAGAILIVLGFAAPSWANDGTHYVGLWRYGRCVRPENIEACYQYDQPSLIHVPDWLHVVRALECACIVFVSIPLVILPIYMYIALGMYYRCMLASMCAFSIIATALGLIGAAVYGVNQSDLGWSMSWCLIVVVVGCGCQFIGFLVLLVALVSKRPQGITEPYYPSTIYVDPRKNKLYTIRLDEED